MARIKKWMKNIGCIFITGLVSFHLYAVESESVDAVNNIVKYTELFYSSGQPTEKQFKALSEDGFKKIIYIAFVGNTTAIADEDKIVKQLNMDYIHIPVNFMEPSLSDFEMFSAVMNSAPKDKTLLHCQVNMRASAFSFLYRVIYRKVPMKEAKASMDRIWEPNSIWFKFIRKTLAIHGFNQNCDECDWGTNEFND